MTDALSDKSARLRDAINRLICAVGPDRLQVDVHAAADAESVVVVSRQDPLRSVLVSVAGVEPDCFSATYDQLHTKPSGDATVSRVTSSNMAFGGLCWVVRMICEQGVVTGEHEVVPSSRRRLVD